MAFNIDIEEIEPQEDGLHDHSLICDDIDDFLDDDDDCDDTDLFRFISNLLNIRNYSNNPTLFEYSNTGNTSTLKHVQLAAFLR